MLLSNEDIERLEGKGYMKEFFTRVDKAGYAILQNRQGHCVFYDVKKGQCKVYADRPLGCRLYPVIYDEAKGIVVDPICHAQGTVTEQEKSVKGKKVIRLLAKIDSDSENRRSA